MNKSCVKKKALLLFSSIFSDKSSYKGNDICNIASFLSQQPENRAKGDRSSESLALINNNVSIDGNGFVKKCTY